MMDSVVGQFPWNTDVPPEVLYGCPIVGMQCENTGNCYGGKIMYKSCIVP